ncbi:MAG: hypothetical protein AB3N16_07925 [Flavobacteriaceae bacterium]
MPEHMAGGSTYFVEMVWSSIDEQLLDEFFWDNHHISFHNREEIWRLFEAVDYKIDWDAYDCLVRDDEGKIHTIRFMTPERAAQWAKKDREIHFYINNRTPRAFRFAPLIKRKGFQKIEIEHSLSNPPIVRVKIEGKQLWTGNPYDKFMSGSFPMVDLAINDGFEAIEDFFAYFRPERIAKAQKAGKDPYIIHWTGKLY